MQIPENQLESSPTTSEQDVEALKAELEEEIQSKKLCSYEAYECTQLTLDGFDYCIRHILLDKTAPFRQCSYIYASNGKRCQSAAPKIEKKEVGYCNEHAIKATLEKNRQNLRYPPPQTAEGLLCSLGHYLKKPRHRTVSSSTEESDRAPSEDTDAKTTTAVDPYRELLV